MKITVIFVLLLSAVIYLYPEELNTSDNSNIMIEYVTGKGLFKNGVHIFRNDEMVRALSPVPEALALFNKSQKYFAACFSFLGIGLGVATVEVTLNIVTTFLPMTDMQYLLYAGGVAILATMDALSLVLFIVYLAAGIVIRYNSVLLYNTGILKKSKKEISFAPLINFDNKSFSLGVNIKV
jgi:hypothetical protein